MIFAAHPKLEFELTGELSFSNLCINKIPPLIFKCKVWKHLKVLESYFIFIFNGKIYSLCQNNAISIFFQNSDLSIIWAFYFYS